MSIDNQTNDVIRMVFLEKSPYGPNEFLFPPLQKTTFHDVEGSASRDGCSYTGINEDQVMIHSTTGRKLRKEIWNVGNWDCKGSFRLGWEKTFVVTEDDFE